MSPAQVISHLQCKLTIIRARNLELNPPANLFVRCSVFTGGGRRIRIDSPEFPPSMSDPCWEELAAVDCRGAAVGSSMGQLLEQNGIVMELRRRKPAAVNLMGRLARSKLLGRAEVTWKEMLESSKMSVEKWITTNATTKRKDASTGTPSLLMGVRIQVWGATQKRNNNNKRREMTHLQMECDCQQCCECNNMGGEDTFAFAAAAAVIEAC